MKFFRNSVISVICFLLLISASNAADLSISNFAQTEVDSFGKQVGFLVARRQYRGANPLGVIGFDLGLEVTAVKLDDKSLWTKLDSTWSTPSYLALPVVHVKKGLPFNIDVGLRGGLAPNTGLSLMGGEISYSPLAGNIAMPAVNLFLAYSVLNGGKNFDVNSTSFGASISKGLGIVTPYAGLSLDRSKLSVKDLPLLQGVTKSGLRQFIGLRLNMLILSLCAEANFGEMQSYGLSLDIGI
ncbi:MAG: hypothetical protein PHX78_11120 [bacterium]|nr:hypothetical protein [bacterium]